MVGQGTASGTMPGAGGWGRGHWCTSTIIRFLYDILTTCTVSLSFRTFRLAPRPCHVRERRTHGSGIWCIGEEESKGDLLLGNGSCVAQTKLDNEVAAPKAIHTCASLSNVVNLCEDA